MPELGYWLECTYDGCTHRRTWETQQELVDALARESWVDHDTGTAVCSCHYPAAQPTFPCDVILGAWTGDRH
jgi:hypothetical protein